MVRRNVMCASLLLATGCVAPTLCAQSEAASTQKTSIATSTTKPEAEIVMIDYPNAVDLRLDQDLSSATAHRGDTVRFRLIQDLSLSGTIVAKSGAVVMAKVTHVRRKSSSRPDELELSNPKFHLADGMTITFTASPASHSKPQHDADDTLWPYALFLPLELPRLAAERIASKTLGIQPRSQQPATLARPAFEKSFARGQVFPTTHNAKSTGRLPPHQ